MIITDREKERGKSAAHHTISRGNREDGRIGANMVIAEKAEKERGGKTTDSVGKVGKIGARATRAPATNSPTEVPMSGNHLGR